MSWTKLDVLVGHICLSSVLHNVTRRDKVQCLFSLNSTAIGLKGQDVLLSAAQILKWLSASQRCQLCDGTSEGFETNWKDLWLTSEYWQKKELSTNRVDKNWREIVISSCNHLKKEKGKVKCFEWTMPNHQWAALELEQILSWSELFLVSRCSECWKSCKNELSPNWLFGKMTNLLVSKPNVFPAVVDHIYKSMFLFLFFYIIIYIIIIIISGKSMWSKVFNVCFCLYVQFFNGFLQLNKYVCNGYLPENVVCFCGVTGLVFPTRMHQCFCLVGDVHIFAHCEFFWVSDWNPVQLFLL